MSGGVDSSVAATLLVEQGYAVTGAYMKQWDDTDKTGACTWKQERRDAMRVAAHLGIDLLTFDYEKEYKTHVFDYMVAEYKKGRTPNPDVLCNQYIKFGYWLDKAKKLGFDYLATGHYADIKKQQDDLITLCQAKDTNKDQTYFLHRLNQEQLRCTMFPLGIYTKKEVRAIAKEKKLPTANKPESMGICFIGEMPMKEFLSTYIDQKPGDIVTDGGTKIGVHDGLAYYTIGQRHLGVASSGLQPSDQNNPLFVVQKNQKTNELVVGFEDNEKLYTNKIYLEDVHFISGSPVPNNTTCLVRFRHRQAMQTCTIVIDNGTIILNCDAKQKAITPGQFAVLYKDGTCLGGGIISSDQSH